MKNLTVDLPGRAYDIKIGSGLLAQCGTLIRSVTKAETLAVVTDSNVGPLYLKTVEDSLKAEMVALDVDTLTGRDWKITWKLVRGTRFDSVAFKKANPEAYALFTKPTESRRFCLA